MTSFERIDETMAHPLYTPNEKGTLEQDPRGECFSIPLQSTHSECSPNGMNRKACRRASPGKDHSSKNRNAKRRSSIAVSTKNERRCTQCTDSNTHCIFKCNRCRQRKIKCSGENDEGLACTNCQSAGYTNCHFVRVSLSFPCHHGQDTETRSNVLFTGQLQSTTDKSTWVSFFCSWCYEDRVHVCTRPYGIPQVGCIVECSNCSTARICQL